ncbi:IS3 family transposase [Caldichromatium japonicum]|nr:IS3 family transposase [Caldichromatium japonicum]QIK37260.1 IS3 family transposase [Caldichromatium japonicum]QIK37439.1 IS3 family transposase [Caldichromatium japonicum]QIK38251.1 IS3 family transposase [Caldichromatium japonicum]
MVLLHPTRRGPKPKISDVDLLAAIRADLEASPFVGEGHRKVGARLRILSGIRVSKDRVCRLMRENALLSPHRVPQGSPSAHDGSIQAEAPNQMWGTDGIRIQTVDACCVSIHRASGRVQHYRRLRR